MATTAPALATSLTAAGSATATPGSFELHLPALQANNNNTNNNTALQSNIATAGASTSSTNNNNSQAQPAPNNSGEQASSSRKRSASAAGLTQPPVRKLVLRVDKARGATEMLQRELQALLQYTGSLGARELAEQAVLDAMKRGVDAAWDELASAEKVSIAARKAWAEAFAAFEMAMGAVVKGEGIKKALRAREVAGELRVARKAVEVYYCLCLQWEEPALLSEVREWVARGLRATNARKEVDVGGKGLVGAFEADRDRLWELMGWLRGDAMVSV